MNIIILGVRIIEDSDNRGSNNRGCTVPYFIDQLPLRLIGRAKRAPHWGVQSRFRVIYIYLYHSCCSNSHGLKMIFPGNFLSGIVYFPVISLQAVYISLQAVYISLLFSLTAAAAVSSYYIMTKW